MRLLLDTQILVWATQASFRISKPARDALADPVNHRFVSLASIWEIAIKRTIGKLPITETMIDKALYDLVIDELPLLREHISIVSSLPLHHRDPFDRLLIAQAKAEGLTIVTSDRAFAGYGIPILAG